MGKFIDLTGQRFGRLTVVERAENDARGQPRWHCVCECGKHSIVYGANLRGEIVKSCGCLLKEKSAERCHVLAKKHGQSHTKLYYVYMGMKARCYNPKHIAYHNYGAKGITVCVEWQQFEPFYEWAMKNGYQEGLTIDRIDNSKGYSPDNCRMVTRNVQANNMTTNRIITYEGRSRTLSQWSNELNIPYGTLRNRLYTLNWSVEKAFTTPVRKR